MKDIEDIEFFNPRKKNPKPPLKSEENQENIEKKNEKIEEKIEDIKMEDETKIEDETIEKKKNQKMKIKVLVKKIIWN